MPPRRKRSQSDVVDLACDDVEDVPSSSKKKQRKKATPNQEEEEKRVNETTGKTVRFRHSPTAEIVTRIERALSIGAGFAHRLYLIDSEQLAPVGSPRGAKRKFAVMGTTGNLYDVTICRTPTCTCPDRLRRNSVCKHILFVLLRVLRRSRDDPLIWQDVLLSSEVDQLLAHFGDGPQIDQSVLASAQARKTYQELTGKASSQEQPAVDTSARPLEGQDCPICYETMSSGGEATTACTTCRNSMHESCFGRWADQKRGTHQAVTCVYCRTPWPAAGAATPGSASKGGYLNLAQGQRDIPSYADLYGTQAARRRQNFSYDDDYFG